ncbi:hypothetical protein ABID29_000461 [Streptococcus rupicaprae]|uniref:Uncharacterized protein n=1 Tax=Streptococcus rupicaprae TaxID=759619 RepID=A0ABV2FFL3_9STRE
MRFIRALFAYGLAGFLVPLIWQLFASQFGYFTGYVAGATVIGPVWYLIHYRGLIPRYGKGASIDMGLAIASAVLTREIFKKGLNILPQSGPTLVLLIFGAVLAGLMAWLLESGLGRKRK